MLDAFGIRSFETSNSLQITYSFICVISIFIIGPGFIKHVKITDWVSPMAIVKKKKWKTKGMCRLSEAECVHSERSFSVAFHYFATGGGRRSR